jgi:hypothetical protein
MVFLSSTVTVVLLTFEALVVALVADVVTTYQTRQVDNKEATEIETIHSHRASLGEIELRQALDSPVIQSIVSVKKRSTALVSLGPNIFCGQRTTTNSL